MPGEFASGAGEFASPNAVAVDGDTTSAEHGDLYVADGLNHRVQILSPAGAFVSMFGWEVNGTKDKEPGAKQDEKNVCTAVSGNVCKVGVEGAAVGQFGESLRSITVDPTSGDVYVAEVLRLPNNGERPFAYRIQVFTAGGEFVLEIGREVNETTKENRCTEEEIKSSGVKCVSPAPVVVGSTEGGAFNLESGGDLLAIGGPEGLLYVGDEHRVQEFDPTNGKWKREISLALISSERENGVAALALDDSCSLHEPSLTESTSPTCKEFDPEYGDLYVVYNTNESTDTIHKFTSAGMEVDDGHFPLTLAPRESNSGAFKVEGFNIGGLAVDGSDRLAVAEQESLTERSLPNNNETRSFGSLLDSSTGRLITEFSLPTVGTRGLSFDLKDELYAAVSGDQELISYRPVAVAELLANAVPCKTGSEEHESDVTVDCTLNGEVNPYAVPATEVWYQWGTTSGLGSETPKRPIPTGSVLEPVLPSPVLEGLHPNTTYYYRLAGYDENVMLPESPLSSETGSFAATYVPPKIVGEPNASFIKSFSAVLYSELNPENAKTKYFFQYGPCENTVGCTNSPYPDSTILTESSEYGKIGVTLEAGSLVAGTLYHYRLVAESENSSQTTKDEVKGPEGAFTTSPVPTVQATTGPASAISATSAIVSGTVNPDGRSAAYTFEVGDYAGTGTQYGIVFSGPAGAGTIPIEEQLAITGLQPGTTYAYRIKISSPGYGTASGETNIFTTNGLPAIITVPIPLTMLSIPTTTFPKPTTTKKTITKTINKKKKTKKKKTKTKNKTRQTTNTKHEHQH